MKKIILVTGLIIFVGIKTSFSFVVFEEGIGGFTPPARPIDVTPAERATPIIAGVSSGTDFSGLTGFAGAVIGANWDIVFNSNLVNNALTELSAVALGTKVPSVVRSAIDTIAKNSILLQNMVNKQIDRGLDASTADTISQIIARAQELQDQFAHQTRLDTLVGRLETADETKEVVGILQSIGNELEDIPPDSDNSDVLKPLIDALPMIESKVGHFVTGVAFDTIGGEADAPILTGDLMKFISQAIDTLKGRQNSADAASEILRVTVAEAGAQAVTQHREAVSPANPVFQEFLTVLDDIWDKFGDSLSPEGKTAILKAATEVGSLDSGKIEVIVNRLRDALEKGDPAQAAAALRVAGLSGFPQIASLGALAAISPDKSLAENESTAVLITVNDVSVNMPINAIREGRELSVKGVMDETAGNTVLDKKFAESLGSISQKDIPVVGAILAQQVEEHGQNLGIASRIVELAKNHPDLAVAAAGNWGRISNYLNPVEKKDFIQKFVRAMAVMDMGNAGMLIGSFAAKLDPAGRDILTGIAVADPVIDGVLENAGVPAIQTPNKTEQSPHMGTFGGPVGKVKAPASSSYVYSDAADGQQAGHYGGPATANPSTAVSVVAAIPLVPAIVPGTSANGIIDGGIITPQGLEDVMQAFAQSGKEGIDKGALVRALESSGAGPMGENIDISLAGLNLSDYASALMFENSLTNFMQLLYNDLRGAGSLKNVNVNGKDFVEFASPQAIIKEILKQLKRDKKTTDQRAKLKIAFPERVPLKAFMIIFLSMVIFAIVLGRSVAKYYLDTAVEKKSGCF